MAVEVMGEVITNIDLYCELVFDVVAGLVESSSRVPDHLTNFSEPLEAQYNCLEVLSETASEEVGDDRVIGRG